VGKTSTPEPQLRAEPQLNCGKPQLRNLNSGQNLNCGQNLNSGTSRNQRVHLRAITEDGLCEVGGGEEEDGIPVTKSCGVFTRA
jgi:hypothetical protein